MVIYFHFLSLNVYNHGMSKPNVFVSHNILQDGLDRLENAGLKVEVWPEDAPIPENILIEKARNCHGILTLLGDKIDAKFLKDCPKLKVISNYAVGFNNIDIDEATKCGIAIGNTPDVLTQATADLALALLLNLSRKIKSANQSVHSGEWKNWEPKKHLGKSLRGKTLGIFGMGRIGQAFAKQCQSALGMKVIYCAHSKKDLAGKVEFSELLKTSDVISIHAPLNNETKYLFNKENLSKTKKDCILINTARGELICEHELIELLTVGHFFGVALDVTENEPIDLSSKLLSFERVLITPHIGSADLATRTAMSIMAADNLIAGLKGELLPGFVNPKAWSK